MIVCCVKLHHKAETLAENPWLDFWHPILQLYGVFALNTRKWHGIVVSMMACGPEKYSRIRPSEVNYIKKIKIKIKILGAPVSLKIQIELWLFK